MVINNECRGNLVECAELEIAGDGGEMRPHETRGRKRRRNSDGGTAGPAWTECSPGEDLELMASIRPQLLRGATECRGRECGLKRPWEHVKEMRDAREEKS